MACTEPQYEDASEDEVVYGDQGINTEEYEKTIYGNLMQTQSDEENDVKCTVAQRANDSVILERKKRRFNHNDPEENSVDYNQCEMMISEAGTETSINEMIPETKGPTDDSNKNESRKAWTMEMLMNGGDMSTNTTIEEESMSDDEKMFLYARAVHSNHSIQYHMHQIIERQKVIDKYRNMMMEGMDLISLESNLHRYHPVIISQIINMIEADNFCHHQTFESVKRDLRNMWSEGIQELENARSHCTNNDENNNEMEEIEVIDLCSVSRCENNSIPEGKESEMQESQDRSKHDETDRKLDEFTTVRDDSMTKKDNAESAMMCWEPVENLEEEEPRDRQEEKANMLIETTEKQKHEEEHVGSTLVTGNRLKISIKEFSWEKEDNESTFETEEPEPGQLVYITNLENGLQMDGTELNDEIGPNEKKPTAYNRPAEMPSLNNLKYEIDIYGETGNDYEHIEDFPKGKNKKNSKEHKYTKRDKKKEGKQADLSKSKTTRYHHDIPRNKGENEIALVTKEMGLNYLEKNIFIGDSAATSHMTNRKMGVYDLVPINGSVMIGNGKSISCTHKGKMDVICKHKDGSLARETWEVKIVPELNHDLFSFTKAMKDGWQMNGRWKEGGLMIELFKTGRASMKFDRMIPSGSSWLMGIKVQRIIDHAHSAVEPGKSILTKRFHQITGHTGEYLLKPTAKYMKLNLIGKLPPCETCAKAKIRQRNIPKKKLKQLPTRPGYRIFIDISSFKHTSRGGNRHWLIVVDEFSDCVHSFFLNKKSDQIKILPMWIKGIAKKHRIEIKKIRLDNSGENKSLQKECDKQNLGIIFEFTAPGTPQQNSIAERRIPALMGRARAMLIQAGLEPKHKGELWCEVISTATKLDNIMVRPERTKPPYTLFYGEDAKYAQSLRIFGEMAVVAIHEGKKMRSKLDDRGKTCMFVGYAENHAKDVYRFLNIHTKRIILSRDVRWLNIIWKRYKDKSIYARKQAELFLDEEESSIEDGVYFEDLKDKSMEDGNNTDVQKRLGIDINMIGAREETLGKTRSETKELSSPTNESMERADLTMEDWIQETCFISAVTSGPNEPKTFQEAWHSPVKEERENWQKAIRKEIKNMIERGVWRKVDRKNIPNNRRLIGNKWVFKIKRDRTYRARLVALGYSQIPGVDYTDNFAPVAHDVSFRIALARMMVEKLDSLVMDVETAFLYGDIEEEIFMKSPIGMEEIDPGSSTEDCYQLKEGIYGLCQAARQFWKKFVDTTKQESFGFQVSPADPCVLFKEDNLGICIIIMYVDDMYEEESSIEDGVYFEDLKDKSMEDGNNTDVQKRLGIDINMIGAREETLGKTRSETKELSSPTNESMERADLTMEDWIQETCFISAVTSGPNEPKTFQEAWHSPVKEERENWQKAIRKEIKNMIERGVWRKVDRKNIPNNRRLIGNKWVFKIKRDRTYRARLVALGYSQIPGVDYTDNFAPVAHDVSFRIALARMMVEKLDSLVMDVETAFLYGDIEEEIFMKSPIGMEEIDPGSSTEDCYQLKEGIYGLCQAARQFWKKFVDTTKQESFGFQVSPADPCVLFKEDNLGICIIIMYVDDMLIIGKKEQIEDFASKIQKVFSVKIQHNLADYLGCEFHMNKERTKGWLGQPSIIKSLEQKFGERAIKERLSLTPGTPRFTARRVENPEDKVNQQDHEIYRSGVGTLLYLTKHSRPDICNPVRELSKTMDAPAPAHLKEMYKLIRHVLATKGYGLKFELRKDIIKWALKALSDSDFASDKETRISVFGYIIYFCGIQIAWRSKGMKSVVLSTTEAEYMALSEVVKELKFIVQLLETMNIKVEPPITVYVDNVGAIWLSNNRTTSDRTKHIDIRTSFVKEYQEDGKIIIKFVKSEENEADIFTKNTTNVIFNNHQKKLVWDKTNVDHEIRQESDQSENQQEGC